MKLTFRCYTSFLCLCSVKAVVWALIFLTKQRFPSGVALLLILCYFYIIAIKIETRKMSCTKNGFKGRDVLLLKSFVQTC